MSYLALYRKYRPRGFDEVVGQKEITEILKNQIKTRKFGHAYLFSGIRGTGKTSTAKIMAKAINCLNPIEGNPCNLCEVCKEINNESFMDVIEIDAASNNGVDNVRELRENAKYLPSRGTHKVYIIDEVQMLSTGAFNALLKTLEEPSGHVVFILATTEPEKIPVTILSRCQRYDFRRIRLEDMSERMRVILDDLEIHYQKEALDMISLKSDGAMRDALSLLEKIVSQSQGEVTLDLATRILGVVEFDTLKRLFEGLTSARLEDAMKIISNLVESGVSIGNIFMQMLEFIRNMMLTGIYGKPSELVDLPIELQGELITAFKNIKMTEYSKMIDFVNEAIAKLKYSANPRLNLELTMISVAMIFDDYSIVDAADQKLQPLIEPQIKSQIKPPVPKAVEISETVPDEQLLQKPTSISREIKGGNVLDRWDHILTCVKNERKITHAFLIEGNPVKADDKKIWLEFKPEYDFHRENVMLPENKKIIEDVILENMGKRYIIEAVAMMVNAPQIEEDIELEKVKEFLGEEFKDILKVK
jgi:DNA polymerase-3 subunit gamma/tau